MIIGKICKTVILFVALAGLLGAPSHQISFGKMIAPPPAVPLGSTPQEAMAILNAHGYYMVPDESTMAEWDAIGYDYSYIFEQDIFKRAR